ncbi:agamous-like MADS-box protein AGL80 [Lactuca sativa]|uniref:agamous-like MADS-box protein AGL80 n=1 Tax=Lactuca sativa TaxID=4236 RepID=UPI000CC69E95|nr:agamous-like MADS-box protein AGL80 [Lactuca sativa]
MTRQKVKLAFITNDSARKATYKKRKKGLMKKVNELSTLCGIDACAIIYSPYEAQPEIWPNNIGVQHVIARFKRIPEMERSKNMLNQESFIRKQVTKSNEQLKKQMKENREKEMTEVMYQCLTGKGSITNLSLPDLNDLGGLVDQTLKHISRRIESLKKPVSGKAPSPTEMLALEKRYMTVDNVSGYVDGMQRGTQTQWFTDWINNPSEHNLGFASAYSFTQLADNPNPLCPNSSDQESVQGSI